MSWQTGYFSQNRCRLHYKFYADGPKPWAVLLHGFGQDWRSFEPLFPILIPQRNLLVLHLFFHGGSEIEGQQPLSKEEWKGMIAGVLSQNQIEKADFIGYSMGCKFALFTALVCPELVRSMQLLAPDGVAMNPWYKLATQTLPGRIFTKILLYSAVPLRFLASMLGFLGFIKPSVLKFAHHQLKTRQQRELVVRVWLRFRRIWPDWDTLAPLLQKEKIPIRIVLGKYDAIIPIKIFRQAQEKLSFIHWLNLAAGHSNLIDQVAKEMEQGRLIMFEEKKGN